MHNQSHGEYLWFIIVDSMLRIPISLCINHIFTDKSRGLLWKTLMRLVQSDLSILLSETSYTSSVEECTFQRISINGLHCIFSLDCLMLRKTWCRIFEGQEQCQVLGQTSSGCWEIMACCLLPCLLPYSPASDLPLYCFLFLCGG